MAPSRTAPREDLFEIPKTPSPVGRRGRSAASLGRRGRSATASAAPTTPTTTAMITNRSSRTGGALSARARKGKGKGKPVAASVLPVATAAASPQPAEPPGGAPGSVSDSGKLY
jgi:hypothetical protein